MKSKIRKRGEKRGVSFSMAEARRHCLRIVGVLVATAAGFAAAGTGCDTGGEGDRCIPTSGSTVQTTNPNPNPSGMTLSHDFCNSGLSCYNPPDCPEFYCCPANDPGASSNPLCKAGCAGGAQAILFASCTTSTPSPICACVTLSSGTIVATNDAGPQCACVGTADPVACLAAMTVAGGEGGAGETGADGGAE